MTHEYTILVGGRIHGAPVPGSGADSEGSAAEPQLTAVAWAADTVLAVGTDADVRAISRGDSRLVELHGAHVVPLAEGLEPGAPADFDILATHPEGTRRVVAVIRGGQVVEGALTDTRRHP